MSDTIAPATMSACEIIAARYTETASTMDLYGRKITVQRVRPSVQMRISAMTNDIGNQALMLQAATVISIEENGIVKQVKRDVDAGRLLKLIDELDPEGMKAVGEALIILKGTDSKA